MQIFTVEGMNCGHCVSTVTKAIQGIDPAARVYADPATGKVEADSTASADQLAAVLAKAGYPVVDQDPQRPRANI